MDIMVHVLAFIAGFGLVMIALGSVIRTFVLPRSANDFVSRSVFSILGKLMRPWRNLRLPYAVRDRAMAFYAPIGLLALLITELFIITGGYTLMFWAVSESGDWQIAFSDSGSSLMTLGFAPIVGLPSTILAFSEAALGMIITALLIGYLPTIYAAFQRREMLVTSLASRAGLSANIPEMMIRINALATLDYLREFWTQGESWFMDIEESHTSLAALNFFRSPRPERSWVTAACTILDAAAIYSSTIDVPRDPRAEVCIRAGFLALRHIADYFRISYNANPKPYDPILFPQAEFYAAYERMAANGVPLKPDREQAWRDFMGWRVNYESVIFGLADLTMAPDIAWLPDKSRRAQFASQTEAKQLSDYKKLK